MRAFIDIIGPCRIAAVIALATVSAVSASVVAESPRAASPAVGARAICARDLYPSTVDVAALRDSANAGDAQAMFTLGKMHAQGRLVAENDAVAVDRFDSRGGCGSRAGAHDAWGSSCERRGCRRRRYEGD
jgi:TPR repeat protein